MFNLQKVSITQLRDSLKLSIELQEIRSSDNASLHFLHLAGQEIKGAINEN